MLLIKASLNQKASSECLTTNFTKLSVLISIASNGEIIINNFSLCNCFHFSYKVIVYGVTALHKVCTQIEKKKEEMKAIFHSVVCNTIALPLRKSSVAEDVYTILTI